MKNIVKISLTALTACVVGFCIGRTSKKTPKIVGLLTSISNKDGTTDLFLRLSSYKNVEEIIESNVVSFKVINKTSIQDNDDDEKLPNA